MKKFPLPFSQEKRLADVQKVGIVGGMGVGKSYLFQAMLYRTCSGSHAGALSYYLHQKSNKLFSRPHVNEPNAAGPVFESVPIATGGRLSEDSSTKGPTKGIMAEEAWTEETMEAFISNYESWVPLPQTEPEAQRWYRLRLAYSTGLLNKKDSFLDVDFFDGAGEVLERRLDAYNKKIWDNYADAQIIVFCLPLWAVFPDYSRLTQEKQKEIKKILEYFGRVVQNYETVIKENETRPDRCILALTMADDKKHTSLKDLYTRWINPYHMDKGSEFYLKKLREGQGIVRYLSEAREISNYMHKQFENTEEPLRARIIQQIDLCKPKLWTGKPKPWIIPISAIEGNWFRRPDEQENREPVPVPDEQKNRKPIPVHVELPLLVALCEETNALM